MESRAFKWWNCPEINSFGTVFRIYFAPRKCKKAHISSLVPFWPGEVTSRRAESSDVAGVTRACSNLQILFTSILQRNLPQLNFFAFCERKYREMHIYKDGGRYPTSSDVFGLYCLISK